MITRKETIFGSLSFLLIPFVGKSKPIKSMLGSLGIKNINEEYLIDYITEYTNLIERWSPIGNVNQTIQLTSPIIPLTDFTIDGCMTYHGSETGDNYVLSLNSQLPSVTFSLWYRNGNILPRCFASEGAANPIALDVYNNPAFCFSIRYDSSKQTIEFSSGDLVRTHKFSTSNWTWNNAYECISEGLINFGMNVNRLSDINSIRVYPFVLNDEELLHNNDIDRRRFGI